MDSEYLKSFSKLTSEEKRRIIKNGRPTPELGELKQQRGTKYVRKFQTAWYSKKQWLCGCVTTNRLFCFPCLLFSEFSERVWVNEGYCDLSNLATALSVHERSKGHYKSEISLKTFGYTRADYLLEKQKSDSIEVHNKKVKENRDILNKLICATCFLVKQKLAFRGDNEQTSSLNRGNYVELLNYTAKFDEKLAQHLENSSVFCGLSGKMQDDLIEAVGTVVENNIKEEIARAPFIAIALDETEDISCTPQCCTVLRYVLDSDIKEVFIGFDILKDRSVGGVTECIFNHLDKYNCAEKLVAQTYDGALVMGSRLNDVQVKVRERAPVALFTHCYAHKLNVVLSQSAKFIPECTKFFKLSEALASLLSESGRLRQFLDEIVRKRIPKAAPTRWSVNSKLIQTILQYHGDLCKLFITVKSNPRLWDSDTLVRSNGFYDWLTKDSTYFLVVVYNEIFIKTDTLCNVLQTKMTDIPYCIEKTNGTMNVLEGLYNEFEGLYVEFEEYCRGNNLTESNSYPKGSIKEERRRIFGVILDDVMKHVKARFSDLKKFKFMSLVDGNKFQRLTCQVDKDPFESLEKNYGKFFDLIKLKADLAAIYNGEVFRGKSVKDVLKFLFENELTQTFPEAVKLLQLILTIPDSNVHVGRSCSAFKRIKNYTRKRITNERLSSLALISIEEERLHQMQEDPTFNFYERVADVFASKKERRMDFMYK
ncbi:zinc finger MYM-type protein 1-like [Oratosquilla oratoria]|uniref:zinc finger MYM-type protein 1-like n=1 Tax=Oratosquilla oratoria TaxID=337810 RepID=UPI003F76F337